jgi:hypothetical protein
VAHGSEVRAVVQRPLGVPAPAPSSARPRCITRREWRRPGGEPP